MNKLLIIASLIILCVSISAQEKYLNFINRTGVIVSKEDFNTITVPSQNLSGSLTLTKEVVTIGTEIETFYIIKFPADLTLSFIAIPEYDLDSFISGINDLIKCMELDKKSSASEINRSWTTKDDIGVGYFIINNSTSAAEIKWFIYPNSKSLPFFLKDINKLVNKLNSIRK